MLFPFPDFNPRPREEGDFTRMANAWARIDFNPRPREEGDLAAAARPLFNDISIHALVKRATIGGSSARYAQRISIHALVKRATWYSLANFCCAF